MSAISEFQTYEQSHPNEKKALIGLQIKHDIIIKPSNKRGNVDLMTTEHYEDVFVHCE